MKALDGFVLRHIMDEYILVPTGSRMKEFKANMVLNELSAFVWGKIQQEISESELLDAILEEYDVDRETASADLDTLLKKFKEYGVLV